VKVNKSLFRSMIDGLLIATVLLMHVRPQPVSASPIEPLIPAVVNAEEEVIYVEYLIKGEVQDFGGNEFVKWKYTRNVVIRGFAELHNPVTGDQYARPFVSTVEDNSQLTEWYQCGSGGTGVRITHEYITDPHRYTGGPDPVWGPLTEMGRWRRADGSWFMNNLWDLDYYTNGLVTRPYTYQTDVTDTCGPSESVQQQSLQYSTPIALPEHSRELVGNADGTFFSRDEGWTQAAWMNYGEVEMRVVFHATARTDGGCHGRTSVIDVNDPAVTAVYIALDGVPGSILPEGEATLKAKVLCYGAPVKNAPVAITVEPIYGSGAHFHDDDRPRGYVDGVKITDAHPYLQRTTGADGSLEFTFEPGRDKQNEAIGISGIYQITVEPLTVPGVPASTRVKAGYPDLIRVKPDNSIRIAGATSPHPYNNWGTLETQLNIKFLAAAWQIAANRLTLNDFVSCNPATEPFPPAEWPPKLEVNDISLVWGGLFDVFGWDAHAGRMRGAPWEPPHYTHRDGTVADFTLRSYPPCMRDELRVLLRIVGYDYGDWIGAPVLTLQVKQNLAAARRVTATGPALSAAAFRSDRDIPAAAQGQMITYTLGVGNINGTSDAHNVTLTGTLPTGSTFVNAHPAPTRMASAHQPVWDFGTLSITQTKSVHVAAQVDAGIAVGSVLTVTADASTSDVDANLSDNHAEAFGVWVQPAGPDLIALSDLAEVVMSVDRPVTATIDIINYGNAIAPGTQLTLTLPPSVTLKSATPITASAVANGYRWNFGAVGVDEIRRVTLTLQLDSRLITETLPFQLNASTTATDLHLDDNVLIEHNQVTSQGSDLLLWWNRANMGALPALNQTITYTLNYANLGNQAAASTTLTLTLGAGLSLMSTQPPAQRIVSGTIAGWDVGQLAVTDDGTITVTAKVNAVPTHSSVTWATIGSKTPDLDLSNNLLVDYASAYVSAPVSGKFRLFLPLIKRW
jgi:uncharacterized repeat protein (TIGR01451 family)